MVVSAGTCLVIGGGILATNIGMDHAVNGSLNWKEHGWSALMLGFGGGADMGLVAWPPGLGGALWRPCGQDRRFALAVRNGIEIQGRETRSAVRESSKDGI